MVVLASAGVGACGQDDDVAFDHSFYRPQTCEDNVLHNFTLAWRERSVEELSRLLSDDFRFYLDPATRRNRGIEYLDRPAELARLGCLFDSPDISRVDVTLVWPPGSAMCGDWQFCRWTKIFVTDVFLEVDYTPEDQEVTTFLVEDQVQRFYFRRGRTYPPSGPADSLFYLVEWRDMGATAKPNSVEPSSWSSVTLLPGVCGGVE